MRPTDVPDQGLLCDLLWSDPDKDTMGWGENDRGVSFTFGAEVVAKFLHKHDFDLICRAHQVHGHDHDSKQCSHVAATAGGGGRVRVFRQAAAGHPFLGTQLLRRVRQRAGAMMAVDETLMCSFQILKPADKNKFHYGGLNSEGR